MIEYVVHIDFILEIVPGLQESWVGRQVIEVEGAKLVFIVGVAILPGVFVTLPVVFALGALGQAEAPGVPGDGLEGR
ncbi:hypothetical protein [Brevundimonas sp. TWP2-3-4b1]|uniref:hypothetical protein n=1 Tax=Brevundimonas sp. TWP2-3-4b1 TaxID=2804580 RepID=UPI003CEB529D